MGLKLSNNAVSRLAANVGNTDVSLNLVPGDGALFPALADGDWFPLTLISGGGDIEIVKVTARDVDVLTMERAQEGTLANMFNAGDRVELRATAGVMTDIIGQIAALLPPGTGPIPYSLPVEPDGWIFADGRTLLSTTPYQALRTLYVNAGFPHGQDGSGNPKIPDTRGRVVAGLDNMGGGAAGRLTGATLGAAMGAETHTLTSAQMPQHNHGVTDPGHGHGVSDPGHAHTASSATGGSHAHTVSAWSNTGGGITVSATGAGVTAQSSLTTSTHAGHSHGVTVSGAFTGVAVAGNTTGISTQNAGSGGAHNNVQPTLAANMIVKV